MRRDRTSRRRLALGAVLATAAISVAAVAWRSTGGSTPDRRDTPGRQSAALRALVPFHVRYRDLIRDRRALVRAVRIGYTASTGARRVAYVVLPRWYIPGKQPPLPLVIAPHGRGISARVNLRFWGGLPALGPFVVVAPEGQGRRLTRYSWGWRGQIDDLARMPDIVERSLPWLRIDRSRVYAIGSSMGGQETLMLVARYPGLLHGAAALDSATDMAARYRAFPQLRNGARLQRLARIEIGATPDQATRAYADRSPISFARQIAFSGVPLHMWWSLRDRIVTDQNNESGRLYREILRLNPRAPLTKYVGTWAHSREMHPLTRLPLVLVRFGLIELDEPLPKGVAP